MRLNNRGETVIEVLLSIAIVGLALSASFVLANRSTQGMRQAQERSEALKLAEEQVELLQAYIGGSGSVPSGSFCLKEGVINEGEDLSSSIVISNNNNPNNNTLTGYDNCRFGTDNRYRMSVIRNGNNYNFSAHWFKVSGNGIDRLTINYRTYSQ